MLQGKDSCEGHLTAGAVGSAAGVVTLPARDIRHEAPNTREYKHDSRTFCNRCKHTHDIPWESRRVGPHVFSKAYMFRRLQQCGRRKAHAQQGRHCTKQQRTNHLQTRLSYSTRSQQGKYGFSKLDLVAMTSLGEEALSKK